MNYYAGEYEGFFVLPTILLSTVFLLISAFVLERTLAKLASLFRPELEWTTVRIALAIPLSVILLFVLFMQLPRLFLEGTVETGYVTFKEGETRLSIWCTWEHSHGMSSIYDERFYSFDLKSGKKRGWIDPVRGSYFDNFGFYGPYDATIWAYSEKFGLALIDLFEPRIVYTEQDIAKTHSVLGGDLRLTLRSRGRVYNSNTHQISVTATGGEIFWLDADLGLQPVVGDGSAQRVIPPSVGRHRHLRSLAKRFEEIGFGWKYASGQRGCRLDFVDAEGTEKSTVDVCQMFYPETLPWAVYEHEGELLIFVTRKGYDLSALRTDPQTGKVLGRIDYF